MKKKKKKKNKRRLQFLWWCNYHSRTAAADVWRNADGKTLRRERIEETRPKYAHIPNIITNLEKTPKFFSSGRWETTTTTRGNNGRMGGSCVVVVISSRFLHTGWRVADRKASSAFHPSLLGGVGNKSVWSPTHTRCRASTLNTFFSSSSFISSPLTSFLCFLGSFVRALERVIPFFPPESRSNLEPPL